MSDKFFKLSCPGDDKPEIRAWLDALAGKVLEDPYFGDAQKAFEVYQETGYMPSHKLADDIEENLIKVMVYEHE